MEREKREQQPDIPPDAQRTRDREDTRGVPRADHDLKAARHRAEQPGVPDDDRNPPQEG